MYLVHCVNQTDSYSLGINQNTIDTLQTTHPQTICSIPLEDNCKSLLAMLTNLVEFLENNNQCNSTYRTTIKYVFMND